MNMLHAQNVVYVLDLHVQEYGKAVELEPTNSEFHVRLRQALPEV